MFDKANAGAQPDATDEWFARKIGEEEEEEIEEDIEEIEEAEEEVEEETDE
jgi:hypothetical protein